MARTYITDLQDAFPDSDIEWVAMKNAAGEETGKVIIRAHGTYVAFTIFPEVWKLFDPGKSEALIRGVALLELQIDPMRLESEANESGIV